VNERDPGELDFCYLTTTGRMTGSPHRIEIWFGLHDGTLYLLSGGGERSDWVRNLMVAPDVVVELGDRRHAARARLVTDPEEDGLARRLLVEKYTTRDPDDLGAWSRTALPVAIDLP
jgi:deazaflavin-dependent oxidoreductase (nitroreductase family)